MAALFLLVMGSIYTGVCTPTEAGAIGAFGAIAITFFTRRLTMKNFKSAMLDSALLVSMLLLVLMCAAIFTKFMAVSELPFWLGQTISNLHLSPILVMIFIMISVHNRGNCPARYAFDHSHRAYCVSGRFSLGF